MFTLILVYAIPGFFNYAGEVSISPFSPNCTAAEALRIARLYLNSTHDGQPLYKSIGIKVGDSRKSPVLWVK